LKKRFTENGLMEWLKPQYHKKKKKAEAKDCEFQASLG
jgi:hypothetical protein